MRMVLRFGKNLLFVLFLAWLTLLPTIGPLPVIAHTLDIFVSLKIKISADFIQNKQNKSLKPLLQTR